MNYRACATVWLIFVGLVSPVVAAEAVAPATAANALHTAAPPTIDGLL